jgi:hypothetical protein
MGIEPTSEPWVATSLSQKKPGPGEHRLRQRFAGFSLVIWVT